MAGKRGKITADKARERISSLEDSIRAREQKLEQLKARIARSTSPEEKLLNAEQRLERRLNLEREQLQKLKRLLARHLGSNQESGDSVGNEEFEELHRSFEEVRQDLTHMKRTLENAELPRDLPTRLSAFEERISRREEADSGLFSQLMDLQTSLEQERQVIRKLSRRNREQDQSLEALREAVEDSVVATVDLAERLDELEEHINEDSPSGETPPEARDSSGSFLQLAAWKETWDERVESLEQTLSKALETLRNLEEQSKLQNLPEPTHDTEQLHQNIEELRSRLSKLEERAVEAPAPELASLAPAQDTPSLQAESREESSWTPAQFAPSGSRGKIVAKFSQGDSFSKR